MARLQLLRNNLAETRCLFAWPTKLDYESNYCEDTLCAPITDHLSTSGPTKRRLEMDLMEKVRQVGDSYELNKFRTLNKTIELDARLANERLLATKFRLNELSSINDRLTRELLGLRNQNRAQERKLLVAQTMLRQLLERADQSRPASKSAAPKQASGGRRAHKSSKLGKSRAEVAVATGSREPAQQADERATGAAPALGQRASRSNLSLPDGWTLERASLESQGTQTARSQFSRTKLIIDDLRRRLNLVARTKSPGELRVSLFGCAA